MEFEIEIYEKEDGSEPVKDFLESLPPKLQAKVLRDIDLLGTHGNTLREPYTKKLNNDIFELRTKLGSDNVRVLYFFIVGRKIVLTNGFVKKSQKTPKNQMELAETYRSKYLAQRR